MMNLIKRLPFFLLLIGFTLNFVSCDPNAVEIELAAVGVDDLVSEDEVEVPEGDTETGDDGETGASFAAVILNGDFEDYIYKNGTVGGVSVDNDQDNADAFNMTPSSSVISNTGATVDSPFTWSNSDLKTAIANASGCADTSYVGGVTSSVYEGNWAIKLDETNRRLYQPFDVEVGVTYTIKLWVKLEGDNSVDIYALNKEITSEATLSDDSDASLTISGNGVDTDYAQYSFEFTATSSTAVFYAVPSFNDTTDSGKACEFSDEEIFIDNISVETPGYETGDTDTDPVEPDPIAGIAVTVNLPEFEPYDSGSGLKDSGGYTFWRWDDNESWSNNPYASTSTGNSGRGAKYEDGHSRTITATDDLGDIRTAYQAFTVTPGAEYTLEYYYKSSGTATDYVEVLVLDGHYAKPSLAIASTPLLDATSDSVSTDFVKVSKVFTANASGEVAVMMSCFIADGGGSHYIDSVSITAVVPADEEASSSAAATLQAAK